MQPSPTSIEKTTIFYLFISRTGSPDVLEDSDMITVVRIASTETRVTQEHPFIGTGVNAMRQKERNFYGGCWFVIR